MATEPESAAAPSGAQRGLRDWLRDRRLRHRGIHHLRRRHRGLYHRRLRHCRLRDRRQASRRAESALP